MALPDIQGRFKITDLPDGTSVVLGDARTGLLILG
jgi:hypothetical protein